MWNDRDRKYCKRIESICDEQPLVYLKKNDKIIYIEKNPRMYDSTYGVSYRDAFGKAKKVLDSAITEYIAGVFKKYVLSKH